MFRRWNGSAWQDVGFLRRFNGSAWQDVSFLRRYDVSGWVDILRPTLTTYSLSYDNTAGSIHYTSGNTLTFDLKTISGAVQNIGYRLVGFVTNPTCSVTLSNMVPDGSAMVGCYLVAQNKDGTFVNRYIGAGNGTFSHTFSGTFEAVGVYVDCNPGHYIKGTFSDFKLNGTAYSFS